MKEIDELFLLTLNNSELEIVSGVGKCRLWTGRALDILMNQGWNVEAREVKISNGYTHSFLRVTVSENVVIVVDGTGTIFSDPYIGLEEDAPDFYHNNHLDKMIMAYSDIVHVDKVEDSC